jgi:hypothetical protein
VAVRRGLGHLGRPEVSAGPWYGSDFEGLAEHPLELGRPGALYFVTLGWLTPSRFGIWLLTRPASFQALGEPLLQAATQLRRLLLVAFALWVAAVALAIASGFL